MGFYTKSELEWIWALVDEAVHRASSDEKKQKLIELRGKVEEFSEVTPVVHISDSQIKDAKDCVERLDKLTKEYTEISDLGDIATYDLLKKEVLGILQYMATLKDLYLREAERLEDYVKKVYKVKIIDELLATGKTPDGKKYSYSYADKAAEADPRYIQARETVREVQKVADTFKTKYQLGNNIFSAIMQSVSSAGKEKFSSDKDS